MIISQLTALVGFEVDKKELGDLNKTLSSLKKGLIGLATAFVAGKTVSEVQKVAASLDDLNNRAKALNITTQSLQELDFALENVGFSAGSASGFLGSMTRRLERGRGSLGGYQKSLNELGLTYKDIDGLNPDQVFLKIADAIQVMQNGDIKQQAVSLNAAAQIFDVSGSQKLIPLLKQGSKGFANLAAEARKAGIIIDTNEIENAAKYSTTVTNLNARLGALKTRIALELMPYFEKATEAFIAFYDANQAWIRIALHKTISSVGSAMQTLANWTEQAVGFFKSATQWSKEFDVGLRKLLVSLGILATTYGIVWLWKYQATWKLLLGMSWTNMIMGVKAFTASLRAMGITGAIAWLKAFAPVVAIAALVALIGLALEDLWVWVNGGESVIGDMFGTFEEGWKHVQAILLVLLVILGAVLIGLTWPVVAIAAIIAALIGLVTYWDEVVEVMSRFWEWCKEAASGAWDTIWGGLKDGFQSAKDWIVSAFMGMIDTIKNAFASMIAGVTGGIDKAIGFAKKIPGVKKLFKDGKTGEEAAANAIGGGMASPVVDTVATINKTENNRPQSKDYTIENISIDASGMSKEDAKTAVQEGTEAALRRADADFSGGLQ